MVSYQLTTEQQDLRATVAEFARNVVAPVIGGNYERGEFPYDIVARRFLPSSFRTELPGLGLGR